MAQNLRAKLPSSDKLVIFDKNEDATSRFVKENQDTEVASNVRDVAEKSVCCHWRFITSIPVSYDEYFSYQ